MEKNIEMEELVASKESQEKALLASKTAAGSVHLRSDMAQEIISHRPQAFERWALLVFFTILLLLVAASWFIKYPDIIETRAILTATNAPKEIIPRQGGRLVRLLARNNQEVTPDFVIGWIESTADHEALLSLSRQLDSGFAMLERNDLHQFSGKFRQYYSDLGEVQPAYQEFIKAWQLFSDYLINGFYTRKRAQLQADIATMGNVADVLQRQKVLSERDNQLADATFNMNKRLFDEKVLSSDEFRKEESKLVSKQMAGLQMENALLTNEAQRREKLKELEQLDHDISQQVLVFKQAMQSLKSAVDNWKLQYVLQAPIEGKVVFTVPLQENQFLPQGKLIGYINPESTHFYAETHLPQRNFGKVAKGLRVQLRFDAYPYQEAGFVEGTLDYISNVPSDSSSFPATIQFNKGLVTNTGKPLAYKSGLQAHAIIVTKDMRLLERFYYNLVRSTATGQK